MQIVFVENLPGWLEMKFEPQGNGATVDLRIFFQREASCALCLIPGIHPSLSGKLFVCVYMCKTSLLCPRTWPFLVVFFPHIKQVLNPV